MQSVTDQTVAVRPAIGLAFASLFRADFTVLLQSSRTLVLNIAVPVIIVVITNFSGGKSSFLTLGFELSLALSYGLIASSLIGYSITVARDRDAGVFQRLRVTPAPTWAIMTSRLLVQVVVDLILTVVVAVIFGVLHRFAYTPTEYLLLVVVSLIGAAVFLSIGQGVVALVRSATAVNAIGRLLYVVLILLGLIGSSGLLGKVIQQISLWSPVGAVIDLYANALGMTHWDGNTTVAVIACAGYIVIFAFVGIRWFRWESR
jgi:ABC-2 type transport system permease protein